LILIQIFYSFIRAIEESFSPLLAAVLVIARLTHTKHELLILADNSRSIKINFSRLSEIFI
jgi:hypothetical protein